MRAGNNMLRAMVGVNAEYGVDRDNLGKDWQVQGHGPI
jgi:hypothetical protein